MEEPDQQCDTKLSFDTQKQARATATVARFQHGGQRLKAYKCKICGLWHLATVWEKDKD
ncbi:MAG: hypothetical protein M3Q79_02445 [bacterium]|nr:hypothetical protein [bacterium]